MNKQEKIINHFMSYLEAWLEDIVVVNKAE